MANSQIETGAANQLTREEQIFQQFCGENSNVEVLPMQGEA